jgi:hypothetical protein
MKSRIVGLLAVIVFAGPVLGQAAQEVSGIEVYKAGEAVSLDAQKQPMLQFWLQQLMLSALYRNAIQDSSLDEWQRRLSVPTRIHCRYQSAVALAIPERPTLSFEEALLPLPSAEYPDFIFVKRGARVQRLAKYNPWVLRKLVSEANLLPLYEDLSQVERTLF